MNKILVIIFLIVAIAVLASITILWPKPNFEQQLHNYADESSNTISVHFQLLNSGETIDINPDEKYTPSSLLKVRVMMAFLALAQNDPSILERKLNYDGQIDFNARQTIKPSNPISAGKYTVKVLIERMIIFSDNNALFVLHTSGIVSDQVFDRVLSFLGIQAPSISADSQDFMTPADYSKLLLALNNSTFLNETMSQKAIAILLSTQFKEGLRAGVGNTPMAHKFGEAPGQFHDCGIVYHSKPYVLCVMTKGSDQQELIQNIKDISEMTYNYVNNL